MVTRAFGMLSKFRRVSRKTSVPPKSCMPRMENMKTKSRSTRRKSLSCPNPFSTVSISTRSPLCVRRIFIERKTRMTRNVRSTVNPRPTFWNTISTTDVATMTASNRLALSAQYPLRP